MPSQPQSSSPAPQTRKKPIAVLLPPRPLIGSRSNSGSSQKSSSSPSSSHTNTSKSIAAAASPASVPSDVSVSPPHSLTKRTTHAPTINTSFGSSPPAINVSRYDPDDSEEFLRAIASVDVDGTSKSFSRADSGLELRDEEFFADDMDIDIQFSPNNHPGSSQPSGSSPSSSSGDGSDKTKSTWMTVISWLALLVAVFSMAAVGPMFLWLEKQRVPPVLAIVWRQTSQILFLIPPTILEYWLTPVTDEQPGWWTKRVASSSEEELQAQRARKKLERAKRRQRLEMEMASHNTNNHTRTTRIEVQDDDLQTDEVELVDPGLNPWMQMLNVSFSWAISVSLWVIALPFTSAARASLFSSLYPIMIMGYMRVWKKIPVSLGEFIGVLVCLVGIASSEILSSLYPDTNTLAAQQATAVTNSTALFNTTAEPIGPPSILPTGSLTVTQLQYVGDITCIFASTFIACNVVTASPTRKVVPLFAFTLITSIMVGILMLLTSLGLEHTEFSMHPTMGVFGWLATTEMTIRVLLFGLIVGMVGVLGFNFSVSYINPILFSTVQLLDPGISGVMSAVFGVEGWPVLSTYIGVVIVTIGIFVVVVYQQRRENAAKEETNYELVELQERK